MANQFDLTSVHARAICDEIGARLGCILRSDRNELPPRLRDLVCHLAQMEDEAPSLAPSLEHMAMPQMDAA